MSTARGYFILRGMALLAAAVILAATPPAAGAPEGAPPAAGTKRDAPVRFGYRYAEGQILRQTSRQVQRLSSEDDPTLANEMVSVGRADTRVLKVDPNGTATLDEVTTYESEPGKTDHRRIRTTRLGEILKAETIEGDPSTFQAGALFVDRPVRPGDLWKTRVKGTGGGPAWFVPLEVTFKEIKGRGAEARAYLGLRGRMDAARATAMLGPAAVMQGVSGVECIITGEVVFRVEAGREDSSRMDLDCALEVTRGDRPTVPATLKISYETTSEGSSIPSIPSP